MEMIQNVSNCHKSERSRNKNDLPYFIGQFQKISIHHDGRLQYFNPPLPSEIPKCVTPPCPQNSIIVNPPPPRNFSFFLKPFGITKCVHKMPNLGYFTSIGFTSLTPAEGHFVVETRLAMIHVCTSNENAYQERRVSYLGGVFNGLK